MDPKGLFVDIPTAVATGARLVPSVTLTGQKILVRGNLAAVERTGTLTGLTASFGGSYKVAGELDIANPTSSSDRRYIANAGVGTPGFNAGGLSYGRKLPVGTCLRW